MELKDYLRVLRSSWIVISLFTLLGTGVAFGLATRTTATEYEAISSVYIAESNAADPNDLSNSSETTSAKQLIPSLVNLVTSGIVIEQVAEVTGESPDSLRANISAESPDETVIINIKATGNDSSRVALIADETAKALAETVENKLDLRDKSSVSALQAVIIQPGLVRQTSTSANVSKYVIVGLLSGLALGLAIAVLRDAISNRIRSDRDITSLTAAPILGTFPMSAFPLPKQHQDVLLRNPSLNEAFRSLRTSLLFSEGSSSARWTFTSITDERSNVEVAAGLAVALTATERTTVLLDTDFSHSTLSKLFQMEAEHGLADYLRGEITVRTAVHQSGDTNLAICPVGNASPLDEDLLSSPRFNDFVDDLASQYDTLIIVAPPVLSSANAIVAAKNTPRVLLTINTDSEKRSDMASALDIFDTNDMPISGLVIVGDKYNSELAKSN